MIGWKATGRLIVCWTVLRFGNWLEDRALTIQRWALRGLDPRHSGSSGETSRVSDYDEGRKG